MTTRTTTKETTTMPTTRAMTARRTLAGIALAIAALTACAPSPTTSTTPTTAPPPKALADMTCPELEQVADDAMAAGDRAAGLPAANEWLARCLDPAIAEGPPEVTP